MRAFLRNVIPTMAAAAMALAPCAARASTVTMSVTYYTIAENDQDMNHLASGVFSNEVQNNLGSNGLPILNTAMYGCTSNCFTAMPLPQDVTSSGEITWWSPALNNGGPGGTSDVVETGTGTITLPYENFDFYPPNGTGGNDANGFQAAVFSATLDVPTTESLSFTIGADDVAFVYLDGSVVCDLGGVHGYSPGTCTTPVVNAGDHTLELFYSDLEETGAVLTFNVTTTVSNAPEASSLVLLAVTLAALGIMGLRARHPA